MFKKILVPDGAMAIEYREGVTNLEGWDPKKEDMRAFYVRRRELEMFVLPHWTSNWIKALVNMISDDKGTRDIDYAIESLVKINDKGVRLAGSLVETGYVRIRESLSESGKQEVSESIERIIKNAVKKTGDDIAGGSSPIVSNNEQLEAIRTSLALSKRVEDKQASSSVLNSENKRFSNKNNRDEFFGDSLAGIKEFLEKGYTDITFVFDIFTLKKKILGNKMPSGEDATLDIKIRLSFVKQNIKPVLLFSIKVNDGYTEKSVEVKVVPFKEQKRVFQVFDL